MVLTIMTLVLVGSITLASLWGCWRLMQGSEGGGK